MIVLAMVSAFALSAVAPVLAATPEEAQEEMKVGGDNAWCNLDRGERRHVYDDGNASIDYNERSNTAKVTFRGVEVQARTQFYTIGAYLYEPYTWPHELIEYYEHPRVKNPISGYNLRCGKTTSLHDPDSYLQWYYQVFFQVSPGQIRQIERALPEYMQ